MDETITILLIDDSSTQRSIFAALMESLGFQVKTASCGEEGLQALQQGDIDLVICDLNMPDMDGLEVLKNVKESFPRLPFIILTAHGTVSEAVKALRQGAYDFIRKPDDLTESEEALHEIEAAIHKAIEKSRLERNLAESEHNLRLLMENIPDIIFSLDPDLKIIDINPAVERILGYTPQEMVGSRILEKVKPVKAHESLIEQLTAETDEATIEKFELSVYNRAGEVRDFEVNRQFVYKNGRVVKINGVARDITDRKRLEEKLKDYSRDLELRVDERTETLAYTNRQLANLNKVSNRFADIFDEATLFDEIPRLLTDSLDFDRASLLLKTDDGFKLTAFCFRHDSEAASQRYVQLIESKKEAPWDLPPHFLRSFRENRTIFIPDMQADPEWPRDIELPFEANSLLITPLRARSSPEQTAGEETIGLLVGNMHFHQRTMDDQDMARFEMFASMAGFALNNIRAYQNLEKLVVERTQSLQEANRVLRDNETELRKTTYSLGRANVDLLAAQEELVEKNQTMEQLLNELSQNKNRLQTILDATPDVILMVNNDNKIAATNKSVKDFFDVSPDDILNVPFDTFLERIKPCFQDFDSFMASTASRYFDPSDLHEVVYDIRKVFEYSLQLVQPQLRTVVSYIITVRDKKNEKLGDLWFFSDITEMKRADDMIRAIVEVSPIPFIVSRLADGKIIYANEPLAQLLNLDVNEMIGRNTPEFYVNGQDRESVIQKVKEKGYLRNYEVLIQRKEQTPIWMILSLVTTQLSGEEVIIGALYDIHERKKAEDALRRERNFVAAILNTAGALVIVLDVAGRIIRFNRACEQITGYNRDDLLGQAFWDLLLPTEEKAAVEARFNEIMAGHFPNRGENHWITSAGEKRLIEWSNTALLDDDGQVEYVIATGIDITERKQAEDALRESESKNRALLDAIPDLIFQLSRDGIFLDYKAPKTAILHLQPEQFLGHSILEIMPRGVAETTLFYIRRTLETEQLQRFEYQLFDGQEMRDFEARMVPGWADHVLVIVRDITDRNRAEQALRESEKRFRSIVENANDIIYSLTPDGFFSYVSPNWADILGHPLADVEGRAFNHFVHPDDLQRCTDFFKQVKRIGKSTAGVEYRAIHLDGSQRWHISNASAVKDDQGEVQYLIGVAHDITELKTTLDELALTNKTLRDTQSQLVQSEKMAALGTLVAGIAHEINTPIAAINSMHNTLTRGYEKLKQSLPDDYVTDRKTQKFLSIIDDANSVIDNATQRVTNIVKRLRSFARLDEAELKKVNINEGLEDTLVIIHHEIKRRIQVNKNFGDVPPIACYPGRLNQVFLNLLVNAQQAIPDKGEITITTRLVNKKVIIEIGDTGVGIPPRHIDKIFDPGFTTKGVGVGTGLGLSICYRIIQEHRGDIRVTSEPDRGTTMTITIPANLDEILENT